MKILSCLTELEHRICTKFSVSECGTVSLAELDGMQISYLGLSPMALGVHIRCW